MFRSKAFFEIFYEKFSEALIRDNVSKGYDCLINLFLEFEISFIFKNDDVLPVNCIKVMPLRILADGNYLQNSARMHFWGNTS